MVLAIYVLVFFFGEFNYYGHHGSSSMMQVQQKLGSKNLVAMTAGTGINNIFENLTTEFSNAFKRLLIT